MNQSSFDELLQRYLHNELSGNELERFRALVDEEPYRQQLEDRIASLLQNRSVSGLADEKRANILFENILSAARAQAEQQATAEKPESRSGRLRKLFPALAAALLIAVAVPVAYRLSRPAQKTRPVIVQQPSSPAKHDVLPGSQKALLTLGNGTVITLDDARNGTLAEQGATTILKFNGRLDYQAKATGAQAPVYNTVATPRGGQYQVVLPDGSQVWLNAASSIRFPTAFAPQERKVDLTGEAYFEITPNKAVPFLVSVNGAAVKVLGTHFNVMAYADEGALETTLLEGAVEFSHNNQTLRLRPLEQSRLKRDGALDMVRRPDAEDVLAWKNGMFHFENDELQTVMRQLSRWYDVEVEYRTPPDQNRYHLEMPRSSKLSSVLKVLEITADIHFDIQGRKIIVS